MKKFTEKEVSIIINDTIEACTKGIQQWIEKETNIVDMKTMAVLNDAQITVKQKAKPICHYVYPLLEKHGISFVEDTKKDKSNGNS